MTDLEQRLRDALHDDAERARLVHPHRPVDLDVRPLPIAARPSRSTRRLVAVAAAVAVIAAAGVAVIQDQDRPPSVTTSAGPEDPDQAIADSAVLTADDMPIGWVPAPPKVEERWQTSQDDLDQALGDCLDVGVSELGHGYPTAASAFVNSYEENDELAASTVTVLPSAAEAQAFIDRFRQEHTKQCYLDLVGQQIAEAASNGITLLDGSVLSGDDIEIGESTITELFLEYLEGGFYKDLGHDSVGFRLDVPISSEGVEVDVFAVLILARSGPVLVETSFQTYFTAFDGGPSSSGLAPQAAVRLTKKVLSRIPAAASSDGGATSADQGGTVVQPVDDPLALPTPGEQPPDPPSAEEQVRTAFTTVLDASFPREERAQLSERPAVWLAANLALVEGPYGEAVRDQRATVDEVVFTSPTHAAVRFQLVASDERVPRDHLGEAVLVDGRWLVAIATTCGLVQLASVQCDMSL
jgi:hypothetical protein